MINLRYHIVSITAVFLALGIGVALGSTLIERGLVANLNTRLDEQAERLDRTDGENAELREQLAEEEAFDQRLAEEGTALFAGHLTGVPVVVLTVQGTSDELVDLTRRSLRASGATVVGVLRVTSRWEDLSEEEIAELADVAGTQSTNPDTVRSLVLRALADELEEAAQIPEVETPGEGETPEGEATEGEPTEGEATEGEATGAETAGGETDDAAAVEGAVLDPRSQVDQPGDPDQPADPGDGAEPEDAPEPPPVPEREVVDALLALGYLEFLPDEASSPVPAHGLRIVVVVDGERDLPDDLVVLPLVKEMGGSEPAPMLVAEAYEPDAAEGEDADEEDAATAGGPLVEEIRTDQRLVGAVSTVDAPRQFVGQSAIVVGLADLVAEPAQVGHYGLAAGATALLPPVGE